METDVCQNRDDTHPGVDQREDKLHRQTTKYRGQY